MNLPKTREEAQRELDRTVDDLFYIVKLHTMIGDHTMAQAVAKHAHGLAALRRMSTS